jgi:hypothetical protein
MPSYQFDIYAKNDGIETIEAMDLFDADDDAAAESHAARRLSSNLSTLHKATFQRLSQGDRLLFDKPI